MKNYYVNIPSGTKDFEFRQILELLKQDCGYREEDGRQHVRARQPDGSYRERGFLYLFDDRARAEDFAKLVRKRTGNPAWQVFEVDIEPMRELIEDHRELRDEPLVLAMYYDAGDDPREIYLLEVIENFGSNSINPDRELFEMTFLSPNTQSADAGKTWHLILTNPPEFDRALRENWKHAEQVRKAVESGRYEVLFMTDVEGVRNRELIGA